MPWGNATVRVLFRDSANGEQVLLRTASGDERNLGAAEFALYPFDVSMDPPHGEGTGADRVRELVAVIDQLPPGERERARADIKFELARERDGHDATERALRQREQQLEAVLHEIASKTDMAGEFPNVELHDLAASAVRGRTGGV